MASKNRVGLYVGLAGAVILVGAVAAGAFVMMKNKPRKYEFFLGADHGWTGEEDSVEIKDYVNDEETQKTCDSIAKSGKSCMVAVRYGNKVYYRPTIVETPHEWKGDSPSPSTDGSWVVQK